VLSRRPRRGAAPGASFCPWPLPLRSADAPPFGPGLPPARGPLGRLRDRLVRPLAFGTLERTMVPPVNRTRAGLGLAPVAGADAFETRLLHRELPQQLPS
jgi:hypothetical protein